MNAAAIEGERDRRPWWPRLITRRAARSTVGLGLVALAAGLLGIAGASLPVASVSMLVAVVTASLLGYGSGLVPALGGFFVLHYFFTSPLRSLSVSPVTALFLLPPLVP